MNSDIYTPDISLDPHSGTPLYQQIEIPIADAIQSGEVTPGTLIEDEISMSRRLGVSRPTTRQALQRLVDNGLIIRKRGAGTRVASSPIRRSVELTSLASYLQETGHTVHTRVLSYAIAPATEHQAAILRVPVGTPVAAIERLRHSDDTPLAILRNLIPARIAPDYIELERGSLYSLMRRSTTLVRADQIIGARNASATEAELLDEVRGATLLTVQRTTFNESGEIIEFGDHLYRASMYSFRTELTAL
ncbi:GntR family transcriptional regulator [Corynebacterium pacaense]|uniref:GntR family transcriptional regulator n=1 Tax=Corynebacterium pacaense TaxID=1816684 RepID=UPI0009BA06F0|nr:GntR family transcriptional regulator [Corynebacterium pacaense]